MKGRCLRNTFIRLRWGQSQPVLKRRVEALALDAAVKVDDLLP